MFGVIPLDAEAENAAPWPWWHGEAEAMLFDLGVEPFEYYLRTVELYGWRAVASK